MKQVVFAVILMAMASLTGCLNGDDSSDTTEDNTDTKDDGTIEPVGQSGGYTPPETANITVDSDDEKSGGIEWVAKDGHRITTSCLYVSEGYGYSLVIYDSDDRVIYVGNDEHDYGVASEGWDCITFDVTLGPEPVKVGITKGTLDSSRDYATVVGHYYWLVTF